MATARLIRWAIGSLLNGRNAGFDDDVAPFDRLGGDELGELLGRGGNAFRALLDDFTGYLRILDGRDQLLIELGDDRLWRAVRRQQREPSRRLVVLDARFRDRGNVGKRGHALARRNGERPGVAALEGRVNVRQPLE